MNDDNSLEITTGNWRGVSARGLHDIDGPVYTATHPTDAKKSRCLYALFDIKRGFNLKSGCYTFENSSQPFLREVTIIIHRDLTDHDYRLIQKELTYA